MSWTIIKNNQKDHRLLLKVWVEGSMLEPIRFFGYYKYKVDIVTPTLKLACPMPSCTKMVKTAAQLKDHYTIHTPTA
jgi:hypothetical protein